MNGLQPGQALAVNELPARPEQGRVGMGPAVFLFTKAPGSMAPSSF